MILENVKIRTSETEAEVQYNIVTGWMIGWAHFFFDTPADARTLCWETARCKETDLCMACAVGNRAHNR